MGRYALRLVSERRSADDVIDAAIAAGQRDGIDSLDELGRWIYFISEAEVLCDKDGVDSFIDRYGPSGLFELSIAYRHLGAEALADAAREVARTLPAASEDALDRLNELVRDRRAYDHEAIRAAVERQLLERQVRTDR